MSTHAKAKPAKKAKCKFESYICNDRAEAFVGPKPDILPRFSEVPSERDKRAFELAAQGMTQREIAQELHTSQPTVHRGIKKYRLWFGSTLPEDRGELVGWARFRVAVEERKIFLRHQQELPMEEWQQSRQGVPLTRKRTKIYPEGRKSGGPPVEEVIIDEYVQKRHASASHLNAAAKRSLELTMLEAGYLGVHKLTCDEVIDVDERDRWDREVKSDKRTIEELTRKVAELEAQLAAVRSERVALADEPTANAAKPISVPSARQPVEHLEGLGEGEVPSESALAVKGRMTSFQNTARTRPLPASGTLLVDESRLAQTTPAVNQTSPAPEVATPIQEAPSSNPPDSPPPASQRLNPMNQSGVALADGPTVSSAGPTNVPSARQPVEHLEGLGGAESPSESALAVKGRITSQGMWGLRALCLPVPPRTRAAGPVGGRA